MRYASDAGRRVVKVKVRLYLEDEAKLKSSSTSLDFASVLFSVV